MLNRIGPRKILQALQRITDSDGGISYAESPILGPLSGVPLRGRSLSDAFAMAKGTESPPVVRENVSDFAPSPPRESIGKNLYVLIVDDNDINLKVRTIPRMSTISTNMSRFSLPSFEKSAAVTKQHPTALLR